MEANGYKKPPKKPKTESKLNSTGEITGKETRKKFNQEGSKWQELKGLGMGAQMEIIATTGEISNTFSEGSALEREQRPQDREVAAAIRQVL